jgi:hypothetical protein
MHSYCPKKGSAERLMTDWEEPLGELIMCRTYGAHLKTTSVIYQTFAPTALFPPADIWIYKTTAPKRFFVSMYKMMIESLREATVFYMPLALKKYMHSYCPKKGSAERLMTDWEEPLGELIMCRTYGAHLKTTSVIYQTFAPTVLFPRRIFESTKLPPLGAFLWVCIKWW